MPDVISRTDLENAKRDADDLGLIVNGDIDLPNPGHDDGTVTTREGQTVRTVANVVNEIAGAVDETAAVRATSAATAAEASLAAVLAAMNAGALQSFDSAADALSNGVIGNGAITAGSGGTNGTFTGSLTGGAGTGAAFRFVVAGGALTQIVWLSKGKNYTSAPAMVFTASAGLTGASATAIIGPNTVDGDWFSVPVPASNQAVIYKNVAAAAVAQFIDQSAVTTLPMIGHSLSAVEAVVHGSAAGDTADTGSGTFYSWGPGDPTLAPGLLNRIAYRLNGTSTGHIYLIDLYSAVVLKKFVVSGVAGLNTLTPVQLGNFYCPAGVVAVFKGLTGGGLRQAVGSGYAIRVDGTDMDEGDTATNLYAGTAATSVSIEIEVLTDATALEPRLYSAERDRPGEDLAFVGREPIITRFNVGVTADNADADSTQAANRLNLTPELPRGGRLVSVFLKTTAVGLGFVQIWRKASNAPSYQLERNILVPFDAGAQTIAMDPIFVPKGSRIGFQPSIGGLLMTYGNTGRNSEYLNAALLTGQLDQELPLLTAAAHGQIGATLDGPSSNEVLPAPVSQVRLLDNSRQRPRLPTFFMKGVWLQPASKHAIWAGRGVNTLMHGMADQAGNGDTGASWLASAIANGLYYVRRPGLGSLDSYSLPISNAQLTQIAADCNYDAVNAKCLGWNTIDEPDYSAPGEQGGGTPNSLTIRYVEREMQRFRNVSGAMPIFMNVQGFHVKYAGPLMTEFLNTRGVDVYGFDTYPNTEGAGGSAANIYWELVQSGGAQGEALSTINGVCCEYLSQKLFPSYADQGPTMSAGKPMYCFLATSKVLDPSLPPLPGEFRALAWSSIIGGVIGLFYFPYDVTGGFTSYDASDPDILTEMATLHSNIATMEALDLLIDPVFGGRIPFTKRMCPALPTALTSSNTTDPGPFQSPLNNQMPAGFEAIEIKTTTKTYRLILNILGVSQDLTDALWDYAAWSFGAHEIKLVDVDAPTTNLLSASGL